LILFHHLHHYILCLLSLPNLPLKNSGRNARRSGRPRTADERRRTGYFEEEIRRLAEEEEMRRREEEAERRRKEEDEWKRKLEEAEKEYARQKEIERARLEKRKAVEIEESGEETEKEPEGSNKKVSKIKLGFE
jgi:hypothetical protein